MKQHDLCVEAKGAGVLVHVRVQPRASRNAFEGEVNGRIRVAISAPPVEGEANRAVVELVAKALGVAKRNVSVVKGEQAREKTLEVAGVSVESVRSKLGLSNEPV